MAPEANSFSLRNKYRQSQDGSVKVSRDSHILLIASTWYCALRTKSQPLGRSAQILLPSDGIHSLGLQTSSKTSA